MICTPLVEDKVTGAVTAVPPETGTMIFMPSPEILLVNVTLPVAPDGRVATLKTNCWPMGPEVGEAVTTVEVVA